MNVQSPVKKKICKLLFSVSLTINVIMCVLAFTPFVNRLYEYLEITPEVKKADSIVLLSSGYYTTDIPGKYTLQRMLYAMSLYEEGYANKIIICGGVLKGGDPPISVIMKDLMVKMGIDIEWVIL